MFVTVILFIVRVPVLSEQMLFAPPMISQEERRFTKFLSISMRLTEYANDIITASGRPSGTATTTIATPMMRYLIHSSMYSPNSPVRRPFLVAWSAP